MLKSTLTGALLATLVVAPVRAERPERIAVELGGGVVGGAAGAFTLGLVSAGVCALVGEGDRSFGCLVPAVAGGYVGGALGVPLGVWGAGNLMEGDGGLGWTTLGSLSGTAVAATTLIVSDIEQGSPLWWTLIIALPVTGAIVGYELSSSEQAPRDDTAQTRRSRPREWSFAWSMAF